MNLVNITLLESCKTNVCYKDLHFQYTNIMKTLGTKTYKFYKYKT